MKLTTTKIAIGAGGAALLLLLLLRKPGRATDEAVTNAPLRLALTSPAASPVAFSSPGYGGVVFSSKVATVQPQKQTPQERLREWIATVIAYTGPQWDDEASVMARAQKNNALAAAKLLDNMDAMPPGHGWASKMGLWDMLWHVFGLGFFVAEEDVGYPTEQRVEELTNILVAALAVDLMHSDASARLDRRFVSLNQSKPLKYLQKDAAAWAAVPKADLMGRAKFLIEYAFTHALTFAVPAEIMAWATASVGDLILKAVIQIGVTVADAFTGGEASAIIAGLEAAAAEAKKSSGYATGGNLSAAAASASNALAKAKKALASV
jgi:hypothetical protein